MDMRELINLFEAPTPAQGVTGQKLAQTSGGQFMNRADRTNQAKVDAALGPGFTAGTAAANMALAKKFSQPQAAPAAAPAATNAPAPSADNEALKGATIAKAMNPPAATATSTVPASQSLDAGEEIVNAPTDSVAPYNGSAANAMASRSAPVASEPAASNAPETSADDTRGAAAMASKSAPAQTSDQIATAALNTQDAAPAADMRGAAAMASNSTAREPMAFPNPNAASAPAQQNTAAPAQAGGYAQSATAATNNPLPKSDYQPVAGSSNLVSRTPDKIAADAKAGPGGQNPATKSYASIGDFASAIGDKFKGMFGGNKAPAATGPAGGDFFAKNQPAAPTGTPAAFGKVAEADAPATPAPQQPTPKTQKSPSVYDIDKANRKEIASQFDPKSTYVNPHDKDTRASAPGSKAVNTMADFEEDIDNELAEMMRLSGLAINEKAPPTAKGERMVKHIKKGYAKDGKLSDKEKSIAYATAWKQHNKEKVNEGMDIMLDEDGHTLKHIVNRFKHETKNFMNTGFMAENLYDALYDYYLDRGDMPYGIAKAREGDPYEWVEEHFYADMGSQMSEGTVAEQTVDPLSELARLAGLSEDGPGASRLYTRDKSGMGVVPKDTPKDPGMSVEPKDTLKDPGMVVVPKEKSLKDKMSANEGLSDITDTAIDTAKSIANKGIDWYNKREQEKKDYWDSIKWADGSGGKPGASGATADLLPRFKTNSDTRLADKDKTPAPISTPAATKADAFGHALDAASGQKKAQADDKLKEGDELNRMRKIAGLQECGDMGTERDHMQKDRLNVTTNMSSDGTKDVTINAQGDAAEDLLSMLKLAGMERSDRPAMVMIDRDEEMMDETGPGGQPFVPDDGRYIPSDDELPDAEDIFNPLMDEEIVDEAKMKRITRHSNTPDEEYQTVDSIIRQGNDLNREKRQYADKPKLGDNPMAESILDADLNDILESILIRDDKDSQNPIRLTPKSYDSEKGADWSGYNITSPNTGRIGARMEPGKETEYYAADPLPPDDVTGATIKNHGKDVEWHRGSEVDEGWEDIKTGVSDFVGDLFNTDDSIRRRSGQFRDLETMQQKYKPGTPEYDQLEMRKNKQKERYYGDQGEVVDKTGEPIKVLPPDQWKGGK